MVYDWYPTKNYFPDTGKKTVIVIHGSGGGTRYSIADWYRETENTANPVSSHYIVGKDGRVLQCVNEKDGSFANGVITGSNWKIAHGDINPNFYTISIELEKHDTIANSDELTGLQELALYQLVEDICDRNMILKNSTNIVGHNAIDPINRPNCPGTFNWSKMFEYFNRSQFMIPLGYTDNNGELQANSFKVVLGFRDFILNDKNWMNGDVPLENEHGKADGGTQQTFLYTRLEWDSAAGVRKVPLGKTVVSLESNKYVTAIASIKGIINSL